MIQVIPHHIYQHQNLMYPTGAINQTKIQPLSVYNDYDTFIKNHYPDLTPEERNYCTENRNELLFQRGKFLQLAKYGNEFENCGYIYERFKDNKDFQDLKNSKYLNNAQGFVHLVNTLKSLEKQRNNTKIPYPHGPYLSYYQRFDYTKYNMNDYLKMLNDLNKNERLSEDLKEYIIKVEADKLDIYYEKLDKLNSTQEPLKILTQKHNYLN